jgi:hypothetical protein
MINYGIVAECIPFLFSLLLLNKKIPPVYRWGTLYCMLALMLEGYGGYLFRKYHTNHVLFNWAHLVTLPFYLAVPRYFVVSRLYKKQILVLILVVVLVWTVNILFGQGLYKYNSYTTIISHLLTIYACILFYVELIKTKAVVNIKQQPPFFIISGLFFFCFLCAFILTIHWYFAYRQLSYAAYSFVFNTTMQIANVGFYLLLATGFYLVWKQRNTQQQLPGAAQ